MKYSSWEVLIEDGKVKVVYNSKDVTLECYPHYKGKGKDFVRIPMGRPVPEKVRQSVIYNMNRLNKGA